MKIIDYNLKILSLCPSFRDLYRISTFLPYLNPKIQDNPPKHLSKNPQIKGGPKIILEMIQNSKNPFSFLKRGKWDRGKAINLRLNYFHVQT